jgi:hypothetical protein
MKFGNWKITETTLEWSGEGLNRFVIEIQKLTETTTVKPLNDSLYKWIILALNEDWLTDDDLYDLNFAFVFAAGASGQSFDYQIFDRTLEYQYNMLDDEDQFEP